MTRFHPSFKLGSLVWICPNFVLILLVNISCDMCFCCCPGNMISLLICALLCESSTVNPWVLACIATATSRDTLIVLHAVMQRHPMQLHLGCTAVPTWKALRQSVSDKDSSGCGTTQHTMAPVSALVQPRQQPILPYVRL